MSGISIGRSHPRPLSGKKTLSRCRNNKEADNVILIDVEAENFNNVVNIGIAGSFPKKNQGLHKHNKDEKWLFRNVINIDDDETPRTSCPSGVNDTRFCAGTSLNVESFHVASSFQHSSGGDCQFVHDSSTPVRLSKCKRTYSGKASTRNHYGLDTDSECDLSDNDDYPDCDLVEDISGEVQAMWEKAFSRRMKSIHNVHSGCERHDSTSRVNEDHQNVESRSSFKPEVNLGKAFPDYKFHEKATETVDERANRQCRQSHTTGGAEEMKYSMPRRHIFNSSALSGKKADHNSTSLCKAVDGSGKSLSSKSSLRSGKGEKGSDKENKPLVSEMPFLDEAKLQGDNSVSDIDACIINDRERLKETDDYKKAMEEEWASRQQVLHIQAEEAQKQRRLRKRIKAESMRVLDMERRQKQRLEEMRSIQKKDEENMNLKDTICAEVRTELKKLEVGCPNMAYLLHSLGIRVDNWPHPSKQEVQAAFKRALLAFHPDRASRSDIHQLVEAEEKFKLINRMKEKFSI